MVGLSSRDPDTFTSVKISTLADFLVISRILFSLILLYNSVNPRVLQCMS